MDVLDDRTPLVRQGDVVVISAPMVRALLAMTNVDGTVLVRVHNAHRHSLGLVLEVTDARTGQVLEGAHA